MQFGEDVLKHIPWWTTADTARAVWAPLASNGGPGGVFAKVGAQRLTNRPDNVRYPMGAILLLAVDAGDNLPAFGVAVEPIIVESSIRQGVYWSMDYEVLDAWLFEDVMLAHG